MKRIFSRFFVQAITISTIAAPTMALPCFSIQKSKTNDADVPSQYLEINGGVLEGFKLGVTPSMLTGYNRLVVPSGVVSIARYAFANMLDRFATPITQIILPSSLQTIGDGAFMNCNGYDDQMFVDFTQCSNLTTIGNEAFSGCHLNKKAPLDLSICPLKTIGISAFKYAECNALLLPNTLESVGLGAFYSTFYIEDLDLTNFKTIPTWFYQENMIFSYMGSSSFCDERHIKVDVSNNSLSEWHDVLELQGVNLDHETEMFYTLSTNNVSTVTDFDFVKDGDTFKIKGFKEGVSPTFDILSLPTKTPEGYPVTKIASNAFKGVLTTPITIEFGDDSQLVEIEEGAFSGCCGIKGDLIFPESLNSIGKNAFLDCTSLNGTIDFSKTSIDLFKEKSFAGCTNIIRIIFPDASTLTFEKAAFANDSNLSIIDYSQIKQNFEINFQSTSETTDLPLYNISNSGLILGDLTILEKIKEKMNKIWLLTDQTGFDFNYKWLIKRTGNITKPQEKKDFILINNTCIRSLNLHWLREAIYTTDNITIPKGILEIDNNAFENVFSKNSSNNVWNINFNNGLQKIGNYAFANGNMLVDYPKLPSTLKSIGDGAFLNCSQLRGKLNLPSNLEHIGSQAFSGCTNLCLDDMLIPSKVNSIGSFAFNNTNLKKITFDKISSKINLNSFTFFGANSLSTIDFSNVEKCETLEGNSQSLKMSKVKGIVYVSSDVDSWKTKLSSLGMNIVDSESADGWFVKIKG